MCVCGCCAQKFEEMLSKYDKDNKGGLTYKVRQSCHAASLAEVLQAGCATVAILWLVVVPGLFSARHCHTLRKCLSKAVPARLWSTSLLVDDVVHVCQFAVGPSWAFMTAAGNCQWTSLKVQMGLTAIKSGAAAFLARTCSRLGLQALPALEYPSCSCKLAVEHKKW